MTSTFDTWFFVLWAVVIWPVFFLWALEHPYLASTFVLGFLISQ